jgi:hypothetical protein
MNSRRMKWTEHAARRGLNWNAYSIVVGIPKGKMPVRRLHLGGTITLKWILEKWDGLIRT